MKSTNKNYKFIDLFAGIGGFRLALETFGCECIYTSDFDKYAQIAYIDNFGGEVFGDITQIDEKYIPEHDILCGGFPCQAFSLAGKKQGFDDTRGTLFFDVARIIKEHNPKVLFLENVKNLISHDKGNTFKKIKDTIEELGYTVYYKVLNAKDFGVPQNRARVYIICFKDPIQFEFPTPPMIPVKLGDILEQNVDQKYTISDKLWAGHQRRKKEHGEKGNGFGYSLFNSDSTYTSTISARYYKDGSEILIEQIGQNPRKITPREAARLQGFPDNYKINVSDSKAYKLFGNSVAVPVLTAVSEKIMSSLKNPKPINDSNIIFKKSINTPELEFINYETSKIPSIQK
jgi:DNA (cytosine-5)-methyltransferase 1